MHRLHDISFMHRVDTQSRSGTRRTADHARRRRSPRGPAGRHGRPRHGRPRRYGCPGLRPPRPPRARRGDVRAALLVLLAEEPRNGYQLMQEIEQRSDGAWRPSPGSVYPALQQLEDEGLVRVEGEGRKAYALDGRGPRHVEGTPPTSSDAMGRRKGDMGPGRLGLRSARSGARCSSSRTPAPRRRAGGRGRARRARYDPRRGRAADGGAGVRGRPIRR